MDEQTEELTRTFLQFFIIDMLENSNIPITGYALFCMPLNLTSQISCSNIIFLSDMKDILDLLTETAVTVKLSSQKIKLELEIQCKMVAFTQQHIM
jgi:hypothetical protein